MQRRRSYFLLLLLSVIGLVGLAGCSSSGSDVAKNDATTTTVAQTTASSTITTAATTASGAPDVPTSTGPAPTEPAPVIEPSPLADFEEYPVLMRTIAEVDNLQVHIETDNPGTRVIIFENEAGNKLFKSVFVKRTKRLKVIPLAGGKPLYDATI